MILRNIYEVSTKHTSIEWVKFRWTIRKLCIENLINVLLENASDKENIVRFALISTSETLVEDFAIIESYIISKIWDSQVIQVWEEIVNPVLSKLKVNKQERYTL